ncbi:hypothetical protein DA2_0730 [Desulfovibrio sp. A2]|nr:hypothetical protein DA2_0730 [Desulfovibrio sp. A2]
MGNKLVLHLHNGHLLKYGMLELLLGVLCFYVLRGYDWNFLTAGAVAAAIVLCGAHRLLLYIERRHDLKGLAEARAFKVSLAEIERLKKKKGVLDSWLYLGEGFVWGPEHCSLYHQIKALPDKARIFSEMGPAGGLAYIHNVGQKADRPQILACPEHTAVIGTTGIGKTRLFELLIGQRIMQGEVVVIIDPKGDRDLLDAVYQLCVSCEREKDFEYFSLAHAQLSVSLNPLANWQSPGEAAGRITSIMPQEGNSKPFVDFCYDVLATVIQVLQVIRKPVTLKSLYRYAVLDREQLLQEAEEFKSSTVLSENHRLQLEDSIRDLQAKISHDQTHFQKMTTSLLPVLKSMVTGNVGNLLNPERASLTWEGMISGKKVVYVSLNSMIDGYLASNIGKLIVQDLVAYIGTIYAYKVEHSPVNLFVDEFYSVAYEGYVDILNKSRAAGLRLTLGLQATADVEAKLSDPVRRQVDGNIANKIYLRIPDIEQAKEFAASLGQCQITKRSRMRSVSANLGGVKDLFSSGYTERVDTNDVDLLPPEVLTSLPKGQAIVSTQGYPPIKLRLPLLDRDSLPRVSFFNRIIEAHQAGLGGVGQGWRHGLNYGTDLTNEEYRRL